MPKILFILDSKYTKHTQNIEYQIWLNLVNILTRWKQLIFNSIIGKIRKNFFPKQVIPKNAFV